MRVSGRPLLIIAEDIEGEGLFVVLFQIIAILIGFMRHGVQRMDA